MDVSVRRQRADIDMRTFAKGAGATVRVSAGGVIFSKGEAGDCMYIVQSGTIDMVIGDTVVETIGPRGARLHVNDRREAALFHRTGAGAVRIVADRSADVSLHGRRSAELLDLHHARPRSPHPRDEQGALSRRPAISYRRINSLRNV